MEQILNKYGIRSRILSVIAVLLIAMLGFAGVVLNDYWTEKVEMKKLDTLANFTPFVSQMVHELQKRERLISRLYRIKWGKPI